MWNNLNPSSCPPLFLTTLSLPFSPFSDGQGMFHAKGESRVLFHPCCAFLTKLEGFFLPHALNLGVMWTDWMQ